MTQEKIQIRVTIADGFQHDYVTYSQGDVSTEPLELGLYFIKAGWAEDTAGVIPSYTPSVNEIILAPVDLSTPTPLSVA